MSAAVPFVDLARLHGPLTAEIEAAITGVIERGDFILGGEVEAFEAAFAAYTGVPHSVGVGSGTAALRIATEALGIGAGAEVIVPAHTYIASALGPLHAGATPVFCDVEADSGLIDLESAETVLSERTEAILVVDLYGQACDADAVLELASRNGLAVIEDAAQAHGARWRGSRCGSRADVSCFSFYPSKNLGALGDGGLVCTRHEEVAHAARELRNLGQRRKGEHEVAGYNDRLDTLQAAVLRVKLRGLDAANASRRAAAGSYRSRLAGVADTVPDREGAKDVWHLFPIRVENRTALATGLAERGIGTGIHYSPAVHHQPPLRRLTGSHPAELPEAEAWAATELSLPIFAGITEEEVDAVCVAVGDLLDERRQA